MGLLLYLQLVFRAITVEDSQFQGPDGLPGGEANRSASQDAAACAEQGNASARSRAPIR